MCYIDVYAIPGDSVIAYPQRCLVAGEWNSCTGFLTCYILLRTVRVSKCMLQLCFEPTMFEQLFRGAAMVWHPLHHLPHKLHKMLFVFPMQVCLHPFQRAGRWQSNAGIK